MTDQENEIREGVKKLQTLAHPDRLHIAACLLEGSRSAPELAQSLGKDLSVIVGHLQELIAVGFVQCEGVGEFASYSFRPEVSLASLGAGAPGTIDFGCCQLKLTQIGEREGE